MTDLSGDAIYQLVRILFAVSLLGFLFLVIRVTMKELHQPIGNSTDPGRAAPRAELITLRGEPDSNVPEGLIFEIQGVTTLGRAESARVVLDDPSVSAQHGLLRPSGGSWSIEDLGSRNGTLLNGRIITGPTLVECGDSIQLGRVRLRLMC